MKLLLDEMWSPVLADQLRQRGHDVTAVTERPDLRAQPDRFIFDRSQADGRAIVTDNVRDYRALARFSMGAGLVHAGLIFTTNRQFPRHDPRTPGRVVTALLSLLESGVGLAGVEHWLRPP